MNHLPSAKDRKVARVKEDLTEDGFRRVKPLFWKGVKGWIKVLLPAWNLPDDKVLKKIFSLPSGPFDDKDGADAEGTGALDDHTLVTKNIVQAIKQEKLFRSYRSYLAVLLVFPLYSLVQTVQCMLHLSVKWIGPKLVRPCFLNSAAKCELLLLIVGRRG